ncbi:acyl carrier protein [Aquimarina algiphila]|uniref:Acyl carrier protein n=1 Tax=Aquimarina algiphila TaxID=2047982 RepID=A0A554VKT5_9FLAO|nr:acyl carrier protein [Aquimarina algiphila]TSE08640.1 acyl carrier protein [Aquimarina algiphila]
MNTKLWLQEKIAEETELPIEEISCDIEFTKFNMDSLSVLTLAFDLESKLNIGEIDPTLFSEYNTINKLVTWIENQK